MGHIKSISELDAFCYPFFFAVFTSMYINNADPRRSFSDGDGELQTDSWTSSSGFLSSVVKNDPVLEAVTKAKHMLGGLRSLNWYDTEAVNAVSEGCTKRTFRNWSWDIVKHLSELILVHQSHNIGQFILPARSLLSISSLNWSEQIQFNCKWIGGKYQNC